MITRRLIVHTTDWSDLSPIDASGGLRFTCEEVSPEYNGKRKPKPTKCSQGVYRKIWPARKDTKIYEWRFYGVRNSKVFKVWEKMTDLESMKIIKKPENEFLSSSWRW